MKPLISIIIPTYNRGHLIGATLNSIVGQTFQNWECVVVDDGSNDSTPFIMEEYSQINNRIKFFHRPQFLRPGANSCRNFGLTKSNGIYVVWFDSDDLMTPDHLETKLNALLNTDLHFVVAQTANFNEEQLMSPFKYIIKPYGIKASDFILRKINWFTYDIMLKREIANKIAWNEKMASWQDYNYFCKLLLVTENGKYINQVLTHRRIHENSIQSVMTRNKVDYLKALLNTKKLNYIDLQERVDNFIERELIYDLMNLSFRLCTVRVFSKDIIYVLGYVFKRLGFISCLLFFISLKTAFFMDKGFFLLEKAKARMDI